MRLLVIVLFGMFAFGLASPMSACRPGLLEVTVVDCANDPVADATVTVSCRSGGSASGRTDSKGVATLSVDPKDVKGVGVTANVVESNDASCSKSPCSVKLCFSSNKPQ
jgi:hypothetical protein